MLDLCSMHPSIALSQCTACISPVARSLLLNVDVVTQFDPHMMAGLNQMVQDCEACIARMSEVEATSQQDVCCQDEGETNQNSETCNQ